MNSNLINITLNAANWAGSASPYTYTVSNSAIYTNRTIIQLSLPYNMTTAQRNAYKKAQIESGVVSTGKVVMYAYGTKPSINIPIMLSIGGAY